MLHPRTSLSPASLVQLPYLAQLFLLFTLIVPLVSGATSLGSCEFSFSFPGESFAGLGVRTNLKREIVFANGGPTFPPRVMGYELPATGRLNVAVPWGDPIGDWEWVWKSPDGLTYSYDPDTKEKRIVPPGLALHFPQPGTKQGRYSQGLLRYREESRGSEYYNLPSAWLAPTYGSLVRYWHSQKAESRRQSLELYFFDGEAYFRSGATVLLEELANELNVDIHAAFVDSPKDLLGQSLRNQAYGLDEEIFRQHLNSVLNTNDSEGQPTGLVRTMQRLRPRQSSHERNASATRIAVGMSLGGFFALEYGMQSKYIAGVVLQSGATFLEPGKDPWQISPDWERLDRKWKTYGPNLKFISIQAGSYDLPQTQEANSRLANALTIAKVPHQHTETPTWHAVDSVIEVLKDQLRSTILVLRPDLREKNADSTGPM